MNPNLLLYSPQNVRNLNKHTIVDLIRFTPGGVSRVELARQMGLTRAAVTAIVNDLLTNGVVREAENRQAPTGRRPVVLDINPDGGWVAGVDLGATHFGLLISDYAARVIRDVEIPLEITQGPEFCLETVDRLLRETIKSDGIQLSQLKAVGVGVPGPIVTAAGAVSAPPIMPGWDGYPIRAHLESLWGIPVTLNNDAELGALGEWAYGAGRSEHNLAYIKVGTGIGAGLLLEGQIYRGTTGSAGEIGHITLEENGPLCSCGNRGCLEALAGGRAIARRAIEAVKKRQRTQLSSITPLENLSARDVIRAARNGDLVAQQIMTETGAHLGTAIASLVNLFNPGMVVVGGGVAEIGDLLLQPIRQTVAERSLHAASRAVQITTALLGRKSSGMGAIVQALSIALHNI